MMNMSIEEMRDASKDQPHGNALTRQALQETYAAGVE